MEALCIVVESKKECLVSLDLEHLDDEEDGEVADHAEAADAGEPPGGHHHSSWGEGRPLGRRMN